MIVLNCSFLLLMVLLNVKDSLHLLYLSPYSLTGWGVAQLTAPGRLKGAKVGNTLFAESKQPSRPLHGIQHLLRAAISNTRSTISIYTAT